MRVNAGYYNQNVATQKFLGVRKWKYNSNGMEEVSAINSPDTFALKEQGNYWTIMYAFIPIIGHQLVKWPILTTKINSKKYVDLIEDMNVVLMNQKS